ncbi:hypothetical protein [Sporolactobacillus vineae]|uniref:hypothetical protein n=1 Tax=Sporolactobacillus vineae TaxID=444463 RepID=UPI0002897E18|nr:hypothetical protein [Sporolactobacillus vineae]
MRREFSSKTGLSDNDVQIASTSILFLAISDIAAEHALSYFLNLSIDDNVSNILGAENALELLNKNGMLESSFINNGDLQEFVDDPISNVEILDASDLDFFDWSVKVEDNQMFLSGNVSCEVETSVESMWSQDETFSKEYQVSILASVSIVLTPKDDEDLKAEQILDAICDHDFDVLRDYFSEEIDLQSFNIDDANLIYDED